MAVLNVGPVVIIGFLQSTKARLAIVEIMASQPVVTLTHDRFLGTQRINC